MSKTKLAKIIELSAIGVIILTVIAVTLSTTLTSFFDWKVKFEAASEAAVKPPKQVLQSIDAELVEGKKYYDNNLASVKNEDLIVTAHYKTGEEESSEILEPSVYEVSMPAGFAVTGGDVTVKYKQKSATVTIALEPVVLEALELARNPFTVGYKTGEKFSTEGMEIYAVYNDGSKKLITAADYVTDIVTPLASGTSKQLVSYTDDEKTVKFEVPITVSDDFNNGRTVSIEAAATCYALAGTDIRDVVPIVQRTYTSGNVELTTDFTIANPSETIIFGKEYLLNVTYSGDPRIKADIPVIVRNHVEGEDTTIVGGRVNTEASYVYEKGEFVLTGEEVSFAGQFANAVKNGKEGSITFTVESYTDCIGDITMSCGNSYITKDGSNMYWMQPLQINTILDMTVNGELVAIDDNVVLKGCGPNSTYAPLYGVYYEFTFEDIRLKAGGNVIKLEFKMSTEGAVTCFNSESPSTMNIDWINIDTQGTIVDENATIEEIEISDNLMIEYGDSVENALKNIPMVAVMSDGTRRKVDTDLCTIELVEGETEGGVFANGTYTIKATLKSDTSKIDTCEFEISYMYTLVTGADIVVEDDKVYWVFVFDNAGYTEEDYEFFDDGGIIETAKYELTKTKITFMIDVTEFAAKTYYPHARVDGANYVNGENANGDLLGSALVFTNGKSVTLGNKTYKLVTAYKMPSLVITETAPPAEA